MKMRAIATLVAVLALGVGSVPAVAGVDGAIDMFACGAVDQALGCPPSATDMGNCARATRNQFNVIFDISVMIFARLSGATDGGLTGAEFYVQGLEPLMALGVTVTEDFSGSFANVVVGSMIRPQPDIPMTRRLNLGFPSCQPDPLIGGDFVFLGRIFLQRVGADIPANTYLTVVPGNPPSNPNLSCALLNQCVTFDATCVTGGAFIINPSGRNCTVAVAEQTWSGVKSLYR